MTQTHVDQLLNDQTSLALSVEATTTQRIDIAAVRRSRPQPAPPSAVEIQEPLVSRAVAHLLVLVRLRRPGR